ncbi:DMT family transporter [Phreatobacter stygius]|uniref:DMT family transporter n=1 Tax=Phreatobacter stygius TaxID=1940610 RepID=A0A4D7BH26_9HYPH|nr:DMT family transporter [Phreatobacter stygius]
MRFIPVALAVLWGFNWPAVKTALSEVQPFGLRMVGLGVGAVLLALVAAMIGRSLKVPRSSWIPLVIAGIFNIAGFNLATVFAQLNTSTSRAAILTFTTPLWAILMAYLFLGERLDRSKTIALAIGLIGIAVLAAPLIGGQSTLLGLVFPLVAAFSWAAGTVYQKARPIEGDRMVITAYQLLIAAAMAGIGFGLSGETLPVTLSPVVWTALTFHVIGATAIAYLLWFTLLDRLSVGAASLTTFAIPVVGVLSAMALVGDRPSPLDFVGFAAILAAAAVAMFAAAPRRVPASVTAEA